MKLVQRVNALTMRYGASVKFAVELILQALLPGSPALVELVGKAFDTAKESAEDGLAADAHLAQLASAEELRRIEALLSDFSQQLPELLATLAGLEHVPQLAVEILEQTRRTDARFSELAVQVNQWGESFAAMVEERRGLLDGQRMANQYLASIHELMRQDYEARQRASSYSPQDERDLRTLRLSQRAEAFLRGRFSAKGNGLGECLRCVRTQVRRLDVDLVRVLDEFIPIRNAVAHEEEHGMDGALMDKVLQAMDAALQRHLNAGPAGKKVAQKPRHFLVCSSGMGDWRTLAEAMLAATEGDTIYVMPGAYEETVTVSKPVTVVGQGEMPDEVVIFAHGDVLEIESGEVEFKNLTLKTMARPEVKAFVAHVLPGVGEVRFTKCCFSAPHGTGIISRVATGIYVTGCRFETCHLALRLEGWAEVADSVFERNQYGLLARGGADCVVVRCQFIEHEVAVQLRDQMLARLVENVFHRDECAIVAADEVSGTVAGNRFVDCPEETWFVCMDGAEGLVFSQDAEHVTS